MTVTLRPEQGSDTPLLRQLFAETREAELRALPDQRSAEAFLSLQLEAQHRHFERMHPLAESWIIQLEASVDAPQPGIGRVLLAVASDGLHVVDLAVVSAEQSRGHGSAVLSALIKRADAAALPITLNVSRENQRARAFYERHGFSASAQQPAASSTSHLALRRESKEKALIA